MSADKNKKAAKPAKESSGAPAAKPVIDWERIESEYRADVLSLREIAALHPGVSHTSIARKAKAEGWQKDLKAKISARSEELVTRRSVTESVTKDSAARSVTDKQVIEANAEAIATVRLSHRKDIRRFRSLTNSLLEELENQTEFKDLYQQLGDLLYEPDKNGIDKLNDLYRKVISMPQRVDSLKKLAETLRHLISLEREAFNIGGEDPAAKHYTGPAMSEGESYARLLNVTA